MKDRLRDQARDAIESGRLPAGRPVRSWAGKGSGGPCSLCLQTVTTGDVEFELEFPASNYRVHACCLAAWELEIVSTG